MASGLRDLRRHRALPQCQAFLRFPALTALALNQTEAPLVVAQVVVLALLVTLTIMATKKTRA